jgi:hypothetical protein
MSFSLRRTRILSEEGNILSVLVFSTIFYFIGLEQTKEKEEGKEKNITDENHKATGCH